MQSLQGAEGEGEEEEEEEEEEGGEGRSRRRSIQVPKKGSQSRRKSSEDVDLGSIIGAKDVARGLRKRFRFQEAQFRHRSMFTSVTQSGFRRVKMKNAPGKNHHAASMESSQFDSEKAQIDKEYMKLKVKKGLSTRTVEKIPVNSRDGLLVVLESEVRSAALLVLTRGRAQDTTPRNS
eukprot:753681-Hanusia_phi.AAC.7